MTEQDLDVRWLGLTDYPEALELQVELAEQRGRDEIPDTLLLLEHPPTYTRGRRTQPGELPREAGWYVEQGIEIVDIDRGGGVTYHGPGQLVAYPIVDVRPYGVRHFVEGLEQVMIGSLADAGVGSGSIEGLTGVWVAEGAKAPDEGSTAASVAPAVAQGAVRKIGSIGIHVSRGISTHGLAINVTNELGPFDWIVPCGIENCKMTSVRREQKPPPSTDVTELGEFLSKRYASQFARSQGHSVPL